MIRSIFVQAAASLSVLAIPAAAHHPLAEVYDRDSTVELHGRVTAISWENPHARLSLEVAADDGTIVEWLVEMDPPHGLMRRGWREDVFADGEPVTIHGYQRRDDAKQAMARTVTLHSDEVLVASTDDSWMWVRLGSR